MTDKISIFQEDFINIKRIEDCKSKIQSDFLINIVNAFISNIQEIKDLRSMPVVLLKFERYAEQKTVIKIKQHFEGIFFDELHDPIFSLTQEQRETKYKIFVNDLDEEISLLDKSIYETAYKGVETIRNISRGQDNIDINPAINSLFYTVTRMLWTAFECLAKDLLLEYDNKFCNNGIKREKLASFYSIKDKYNETFGDNEHLTQILEDQYLNTLSQVRNILVHNSGKVDQQFKKKIENINPQDEKIKKLSSIDIGQTILLNEEMILNFANATIKAGCRLFEFVDKQIIPNNN